MPSISIQTPSASYDVVIGNGLISTLAQRIRKVTGGRLPRIFVLTSPAIWELWGERVAASFLTLGIDLTVLYLPSGESHKRLSSIERLLESLAEAGADRDSLLLAVGGGVIGDIGGFLAAIYMRGIRYVQVPTTLLAQVDSSVGGKTGVNLRAGKNLVGAFNHPLAVFADIDILSTLPRNELRAGLQESVKSGVIRDAKLFSFMERESSAVLAGDAKALTKIVTASVRVKADVVNQDEREGGLRMILNFGHTIGHAIEAATGYKQLLHGEAIGWGMIAAVRLAETRKALTELQAARIVALVHTYGPLPHFKATSTKLAALTAGDKKNRSGTRRFILPTGIGSTEIVTDVTQQELTSAIDAMLEEVRETPQPLSKTTSVSKKHK